MTSDSRAEVFAALRPRLSGIAYRMTGSVADADDLCQEAWLRWSTVDLLAVANPEAYLVTTITRLALDLGARAHRRREHYVGPDLPEPIVSDPLSDHSSYDDPASALELADSLGFAFLVLLDELAPHERAAFLLHDIFGYPFDDVATMLGRSPEAVRQLASRGRRKLRHGGHPAPSGAETQRRIITDLVTALVLGNVDAVMALLAPDVVQVSDGGAAVHAARQPVVGPDRVARFLVGIARRAEAGHSVSDVDVNGRPGLLVHSPEGTLYMVVAFGLDSDERIRRIHCQLNPDKLVHVSPTGS